jgi:hypothetical protein
VVGIVRQFHSAHAKLKENTKSLERILKRHRLDDLNYESALELSAQDLSKLQNALFKIERKLNRKNAWLYVFGGLLIAETISVATLIALR